LSGDFNLNPPGRFILFLVQVAREWKIAVPLCTRVSSRNRKQADEGAAVVFQDEVEMPVESGFHIADPALVFEDDLPLHDGVLPVDAEAFEDLRPQSSNENILFPGGIGVRVGERHPADGDGGRPVPNRRLKAGQACVLGDGGPIIVHAVGDLRPAVIASG
jgi:hypothetical protein